MTTTTALSGSIGDIVQARLKWLEQTTPEERRAIGDTLRKFDTTNLEGIIGLTHELFVMLLVGELDPATVIAAKPFLDFLATTTMALMERSGHGDRAPIAVTETIMELKQKVTQRAAYARPKLAAPPVMDADEIEEMAEEHDLVEVSR